MPMCTVTQFSWKQCFNESGITEWSMGSVDDNGMYRYLQRWKGANNSLLRYVTDTTNHIEVCRKSQMDLILYVWTKGRSHRRRRVNLSRASTIIFFFEQTYLGTYQNSDRRALGHKPICLHFSVIELSRGSPNGKSIKKPLTGASSQCYFFSASSLG